jgi:putative zinc finger/helix-turn-helix YgiT family protein
MKCIRCKSTMNAEAPTQVSAEFKRKQLSFEVVAPRCPNCGDVAIIGPAFKAYTRGLADAYRVSEGLLTIAEMERARKQMGLSRQRFADYVYVGIAAYKRWLRGDTQSRPYDKLVRLRIDLLCIEQSARELVEHMTPAETLGQQAASRFKGGSFSYEFDGYAASPASDSSVADMAA